MAGLRFLLPMPHPQGYPHQRTVRGQSDWLGLLCRTLAFPIPSRFIPALSLTALGNRRTPRKTTPSLRSERATRATSCHPCHPHKPLLTRHCALGEMCRRTKWHGMPLTSPMSVGATLPPLPPRGRHHGSASLRASNPSQTGPQLVAQWRHSVVTVARCRDSSIRQKDEHGPVQPLIRHHPLNARY